MRTGKIKGLKTGSLIHPLMHYFSAKLYRKQADGTDRFDAAYIVETSPQLVEKDLEHDDGILRGTAGGDLEAVPSPKGDTSEDILALESLLASRVARIHYFEEFGRPAGDWWYDIIVGLTTSKEAPRGNASVVGGVRCWLQEEGEMSSHA